MREIIEERKKSFIEKYEELCRFRDFTNHLEYYISFVDLLEREDEVVSKDKMKIYQVFGAPAFDYQNKTILTFALTEKEAKEKAKELTEPYYDCWIEEVEI